MGTSRITSIVALSRLPVSAAAPSAGAGRSPALPSFIAASAAGASLIAGESAATPSVAAESLVGEASA